MKITLRGLQKHSTRYLADNCYYVVPAQDGCLLCSTFAEAIEHIPEDRRLLDPVALMSLMQYGYVCGNRTLVRGLSRLPLHSTIDSQGRIETVRQLPHGVGSASPSEIAARLLDLLREEVETVVRDESEVVLLLSGGLDSRITAGILKQLQPLYGFSVKAVTWGAIESRDWVYADRICELYGWEHINIPITVETTWDNIIQAVHYLGTEVTGIHLHGMCHHAEYIPKGALILAASYGGQIGQGGYQEVNIIRLRRQTPSDRWQLFYRDIYRRHLAELADDLSAPLQRGDCCTRQQAFEIGFIENYMRRQINQLMCYVCEDFRLYQVFTDEKVVEYMWAIAPPLRDDRIYQNLIPMLDYELARIPWQKTGRALVEDAWRPEQSSLSKDFHSYPKWISEKQI
jgi:asparagine synthase (glutamine-hydrolysing)